MKQAPSSSTTHSTETFGSTLEALDLNRNEGSCPAKPVPRLQKTQKRAETQDLEAPTTARSGGRCGSRRNKELDPIFKRSI